VAHRFPVAQSLALFLVLAVSLAGLAVFTGVARLWAVSDLSAEVRLQPLSLPSDVGLDTVAVAEALVAEMQEHAEGDVALRLSLGSENSEKITEIVIPRLVNSAVIRQLIETVPALQTVIALPELKAVARIELRNTGAVPLEDVALTLPRLVRAERPGGEMAGVAETQTGLTALNAGTLAAGEVREIVAWLAAPIEGTGEVRGQIALGAAGGIDGAVFIHPARGWMGEDLAIHPWARWLVAAILAGVALGAFGLLVAIFMVRWRRWSVRRVRPS
jgi:hypothetical protein